MEDRADLKLEKLSGSDARLFSEEAFRIYAPCLFRPDLETFRDRMRGAASDPNARIYACEESGGIVGFLILDRSGQVPEIAGIAVKASRRRRGIGRFLIRSVIEAEDLTALRAETDGDAVGFYEACGFAAAPFIREFPDGSAARFRCEWKKPEFRVLFFDVGYTLVNEDAVWKRRCEEQAETAEAKRLGLTSGDIYREIEKASRRRLPQYRTVVKKFGFTETAPYRHECETLYADAPRVLELLSHRYELGVIANQADGLEKRLGGFGILRYFTHIVSSWDVGAMKPDPRIFETALEKAGCPPHEAVMIGDRLDNDVAPAKALGMKTVRVRQGFGVLQSPRSEADTPDFEIGSLSELPALFL